MWYIIWGVVSFMAGFFACAILSVNRLSERDRWTPTHVHQSGHYYKVHGDAYWEPDYPHSLPFTIYEDVGGKLWACDTAAFKQRFSEIDLWEG